MLLAEKLSAPEPPVNESKPIVAAKDLAASTVGVSTAGVSTTGVTAVVVDEPPQAASDSAISDMPPALAAFLAFFDSQALTSLLVAFTMLAENKLMNPKENMLAVEGG